MKKSVDKKEMEILARVGLAIRELKYSGPRFSEMFRVYKDEQVYPIPPDCIGGVWEALELYMKENWPSAWSAVKCYEGWESLVFEVERRREESAKLRKALEDIVALSDLQNFHEPIGPIARKALEEVKP